MQYRHKHGYAASGWEEEKPSKIQKVLHFSITALTFLAFAGYLLCMIVQAIKSKGKHKLKMCERARIHTQTPLKFHLLFVYRLFSFFFFVF